MARVLWIVLLIAALWAAVEVYWHGVDDAFGGALVEASAEPAARSKHAANAFQRLYDKTEGRLDHALERRDN